MRRKNITFLLLITLLAINCTATRTPTGQTSKYYKDQNLYGKILLIAPPLNEPVVQYTYAISDTFNAPIITEKGLLRFVENDLPEEIEKCSNFSVVVFREFSIKPELIEQSFPFKKRALDFNLPRCGTVVDFGPINVDYVLFLQDLKVVDLSMKMNEISGYQPSMQDMKSLDESSSPRSKGTLRSDPGPKSKSESSILAAATPPLQGSYSGQGGHSDGLSTYFKAKFAIWDHKKREIVHYGEIDSSIKVESLIAELSKAIILDSPFKYKKQQKRSRRR